MGCATLRRSENGEKSQFTASQRSLVHGLNVNEPKTLFNAGNAFIHPVEPV